MTKNRQLANTTKAALLVVMCFVLMVCTFVYDGLVYLK